MRGIAQGVLGITALAGGGWAQSFEVASVKLLPPDERRAERALETKPGTLSIRNMPLGPIIGWAYKVQSQMVTNAEIVSGAETYDITARAAGPAKADEMRVMLQHLLAERFQLAVHRETKDLQAYILMEAKGGHKLRESIADGAGVRPMRGGKVALRGVAATLDELAAYLSGPLRTPCVDQTGLKGRYDFEFDITNFVRQEPAPGEQEQPPDPVGILQMALSQQLGLRLASKRMPVELLAIDRVVKTPVEN